MTRLEKIVFSSFLVLSFHWKLLPSAIITGPLSTLVFHPVVDQLYFSEGKWQSKQITDSYAISNSNISKINTTLSQKGGIVQIAAAYDFTNNIYKIVATSSSNVTDAKDNLLFIQYEAMNKGISSTDHLSIGSLSQLSYYFTLQNQSGETKKGYMLTNALSITGSDGQLTVTPLTKSLSIGEATTPTIVIPRNKPTFSTLQFNGITPNNFQTKLIGAVNTLTGSQKITFSTLTSTFISDDGMVLATLDGLKQQSNGKCAVSYSFDDGLGIKTLEFTDKFYISLAPVEPDKVVLGPHGTGPNQELLENIALQVGFQNKQIGSYVLSPAEMSLIQGALASNGYVFIRCDLLTSNKNYEALITAVSNGVDVLADPKTGQPLTVPILDSKQLIPVSNNIVKQANIWYQTNHMKEYQGKGMDSLGIKFVSKPNVLLGNQPGVVIVKSEPKVVTHYKKSGPGRY